MKLGVINLFITILTIFIFNLIRFGSFNKNNHLVHAFIDISKNIHQCFIKNFINELSQTLTLMNLFILE